MNKREMIIQNINDSIDTKKKLLQDEEFIEKIEKVADVCVDAYLSGNKLLMCGNGGSASDAQHMAGELVGRYMMERKGIPAIALNANTTILTALGNDYDYDAVYEKQVTALGNEGDVIFAISTSGNSANCVKACERAKDMGITTVALTGESGGNLREVCDYTFNVPCTMTPHIQEAHIMLIHIICGIIEERLMEAGYFED